MDIAALVRSADAAASDARRLGALMSRSWPSSSDATLPAARDWVRRWRPARLVAPTAVCGCDSGTCGWCN